MQRFQETYKRRLSITFSVQMLQVGTVRSASKQTCARGGKRKYAKSPARRRERERRVEGGVRMELSRAVRQHRRCRRGGGGRRRCFGRRACCSFGQVSSYLAFDSTGLRHKSLTPARSQTREFVFGCVCSLTSTAPCIFDKTSES